MVFLGFLTVFFFSSLSPSTSSTGSTHKVTRTHTQTHDTPINLFKPITTHTQKNTNHQTLKTQKPIGPNTNKNPPKHTQTNLETLKTHTQTQTHRNKNPERPKPPLPTAHQNPIGTKTHI